MKQRVSFDVFGEVDFDVTEKLTITVGGRYTRDDKETSIFAANTQPNPLTPFVIGRQAFLIGDSNGILSSADDPSLDNTLDGFAWRGVLNYQLTTDNYVYFNYSRGRRPQVVQDDFMLNAEAMLIGGFDIIPAETVSSYELGYKGALFDNKVLIESVLYFYDYTNFQARQNIAGAGELPFFDLLNAGTAEAIGAELGVQITPSDNVELFFTYGFNSARFDEVGADGLEQEFGGNSFSLSPDHSFSVGVQFEYESSLGHFFFTPSYTYKSEVFFGDANIGAFDILDPMSGEVLTSVAAQAQDGFGLINIRAGVNFQDERLALEGYVQNLADRNFIIDAGNSAGGFGIPTFISGTPRFYGAALTVRY